ncbi:peptide ABC transporter permease [Bacillus mangrovi]|uniref:Peptide ABC transporter permease n=1 Tax=Metabacillus mangrovi TaxID=1491830 RepID=A0A7X2S4I4_9BACI|nr:peptide ABC transporter permease [Metabacillus mangrovi]MTH53494.1 peptide ABC transporter permease [Metabacillus mangrovi]
MILGLLKDKMFMTGFLFLLLLILLSVGNSIFNSGEIRQTVLTYDETGELEGVPPYPPSLNHPLGTDRDGYDMLHIIVQGSKYTIGIALVIAVGRVGAAYLIGSFIAAYFPRAIGFLRGMTEPFAYIPQVLIAVFLLSPVLIMPMEGFQHPLWQRVLFEVAVLTVLAWPTLTQHVAEVMRGLWNQEFISAARTLGGSRYHIFRSHIRIWFRQEGLLLFFQQFIQVLIILAHLGLLELFFGGTFIDYGGDSPPKTVTYEWSGLIGDYYPLRGHYPWLSFSVLLFFALVIFALNRMMRAAERIGKEERVRPKRKVIKMKKTIDEAM